MSKMKQFLYASAKVSAWFALAVSITLAGCANNTGLVFVDRVKSAQAGLDITSFKDNPFTAVIEYDYSKIADFDVSRVKCNLERVIIPRDDWRLTKAQLLQKYTPEQVDIHYKLLDSYTWDGRPVVGLKPRPASIKESVPGKITLYCIDDLGVYQLLYNYAEKR